MSILQYEIYVEGTLALAKSVLIKHNPTAELMNAEILRSAPLTGAVVDESDPGSWKYYMNLAGEYHFLDEEMTVVSLDTTQPIIFNRENILKHRATYKEYRVGSQYYAELVKKYPKQEDLIKGILSPVDKARAISVPDYTILDWDKLGIERQETNLIDKLQQWLYETADRWVVKDYAITDELYHADILAKIHCFVPSQILDIRLSNCRTFKAHSFHIWNHLESYGRLGHYKDFLSIEQVLWLYRNIEWVMNNAGKEKTFQTLVENILSPRGIPLGRYSARHNTETITTDLNPTVEGVRYPINLLETVDDKPTVNTMQFLMEKSKDLAKNNSDYYEQDLDSANYSIARASISEVPIKVYESEMLDTTDSQSVKLGDVLVMHWAYLSCNNRYTSVVNIQNPYTTDLMTMTVKEAFITWLYISNKRRGTLMVDIPDMVATSVLRIPLPDLPTLKSITDSEHISDAALDHMIDMQPLIGSLISTESFNQLCNDIHSTMLELEFQYETKHTLLERANYEQAARAFYADCGFKLVDTPTTFEEFFAVRGWDITELTDPDMDLLEHDLYELSLGLDFSDNKTLAEVQGALLGLMKQMGTYDTQYVQSINTSPAVPLDQSTVLLDDFDQSAAQEYPAMEDTYPNVLSLDTQGNIDVIFQLPDLICSMHAEYENVISVDLDMGMDVATYKSRPIDASMEPIDIDTSGIGNLDELNFDGTVLDPIISRKDLTDLDDEIFNTDLDGLKYPKG